MRQVEPPLSSFFVISADGGNEQQLSDDQAVRGIRPDWSPNGREIAFEFQCGQVGVVSMSGGSSQGEWRDPRQVTSDGGQYPKWSPDGRLIAYVWNTTVRVIRPNGEGMRTLAGGESLAGRPVPITPAWSRDGRSVYWNAVDQYGRSTIWSVAATGGAPRLLARFDGSSRGFATDGKRFYFTIQNPESDIWTVEVLR